jgi:hypothetical protein
MPWGVAAAAAIGVGASVYAGQEQAGAARDASGALVGAANQASVTSVAAQRDALAYLDPYRQYGLNAGVALQDALYSPEQKQQQINQQRIALQGEVDRLQAALPKWTPQGENDYKSRFPAFHQELTLAKAKLLDAQTKLQTFEKQAAAMPTGPGAKIEASPWYQFQADLLNRNQDRAMAARGLTGSGFEAEERRRGLIELGAGETERQFARLKGLYDVGAQTSQIGANIITGTANNVANAQLQAGQAQAQGIQGVAGANANMVNGIANSVSGGIGMGLNYNQFNKLIESNQSGGYRMSSRPTGTALTQMDFNPNTLPRY